MLYSIISVFIIIIIFKNCIPLITVHTNNMILLQDKQGKTHLTKFYVPFKDSERHNVKYKVLSSCFIFELDLFNFIVVVLFFGEGEFF